MRRLKARDVMNPDVLTVPIDMTAAELAAFLAERQITGAPVANGEGRLVGVVSLMDLAENHITRGHLVAEPPPPDAQGSGWEEKIEVEEARKLHIEDEDLLVGDIMTPAVYTVPDDTPVEQIAQTMIAGRIHRLLVTRRGHVVGIVTTMDLLRLLCREGPERQPFVRCSTPPQDLR